MKNRPKPGTRSYAANGGEVVKSESVKDGHSDPKATVEPEIKIVVDTEAVEKSEADKARIQAELELAKAELDTAIAENTTLKTEVTVLKQDAQKAEIVLEASDDQEAD